MTLAIQIYSIHCETDIEIKDGSGRQSTGSVYHCRDTLVGSWHDFDSALYMASPVGWTLSPTKCRVPAIRASTRSGVCSPGHSSETRQVVDSRIGRTVTMFDCLASNFTFHVASR